MTDETISAPYDRRARERRDVAVVLLLLQSALGLLSLLGMIVTAFLFPVLSPAGLLVAAGLLVPLLCGIGVARGWRLAHRVALIFEALTLLSLFVNLLLDRLPPVQMELTLTGIVTGLLLPAVLIALLRGPATQASLVRTKLSAAPQHTPSHASRITRHPVGV